MWFLPSVKIGAHEHCEMYKNETEKERDIMPVIKSLQSVGERKKQEKKKAAGRQNRTDKSSVLCSSLLLL